MINGDWEDQDKDAERHGYERMRAKVRENATEAEMTLRHTVDSLMDQLKAMVFQFGIGRPVDTDEFRAKAEQIGVLIALVQETAELRAAARELVAA